MHRREIGSEPGIFDKEYWQEDLGPGFRRLLKYIVIAMVVVTLPYLMIAYFISS